MTGVQTCALPISRDIGRVSPAPLGPPARGARGIGRVGRGRGPQARWAAASAELRRLDVVCARDQIDFRIAEGADRKSVV